LLVAVYLPGSPTKEDSADIVDSQKSKLNRVDFKGSVLFALTILALLLPMELGGSKLPWTHPIIPSLFTLSVLLLFVFVAVEKQQEEPILPLEIFHKRDAVISYVILGLQTAAQLGVRAPF
jgi:ABC-type transport system involved in cytochrome c biogenesis permease subunit